MLRHFLFSLAALLVLDGVWLGLVMKDFYRRNLAHLARMSGGTLDPIWPIAGLVYPILALGLAVFVLARARNPVDAMMLGALFGAIAFAVYDLTNHATLRDWKPAMTIVDIAWGALSCGAASWIAASMTRSQP